jgi:thioredoxin 1
MCCSVCDTRSSVCDTLLLVFQSPKSYLCKMKSMWLKFLGIIIPSLILGSCEASSVKYLDAAQFAKELTAVAKKRVIDVRSIQEFAGGYLEGAENFDVSNGVFKRAVNEWNKEETYFVYCLSGVRSKQAAEEMASLGFKNVIALEGGLLKWRSQGLPEVNPSKPAAASWTVERFDELRNSGEWVLFDFFAPWCGPCKRMEPDLNRLAEAYGPELQVVRIDIDQNPALARHLKVDAIPYIEVYRGGEKGWSHLGYADYEMLRQGIGK